MGPFAAWMLEQEARSLQTRLGRVRPFALIEPMVPAAALLPTRRAPSRTTWSSGGASCARRCAFLAWLRAPGGAPARPGAAALHHLAPEVQRGADAVRPVQRCDHAAQRARDGRLALGARRGVGRRAGAAREPVQVAAGHLLPRSRGRRGDPACAHPLARRRRQPGGDHPRAARTDDRQRHRLLAGPRGGPPGRGAARSGASLRPVLRGMQRGGATTPAWRPVERWISEIVADFWSLARVGVARRWG